MQKESIIMNSSAQIWYFPLLFAHIINASVSTSDIARTSVTSWDKKQLIKRNRLHMPVIKLKCRPESGISSESK
jgi:hypothetical protein